MSGMDRVDPRVVCLWVAFLVVLSSSLSPGQEPRTAMRVVPSGSAIPAEYFGVVCCLNPEDPLPRIPAKSWLTSKATWDRVEPSKARWTFAVPDQEVAAALQENVDIGLILGRTAPWASARPNETAYDAWDKPGIRAEAANLDDWRNYVRTVVTRYRGKVHTYALWNEPNQKASFTGSLDAMVALDKAAYATIKAIDPSATVISSSLSPGTNPYPYLSSFVTKAGGCTCDVIGYHFYTDIYTNAIPEKMVGMVQQLRSVLATYGLQDKPIWNTEAGYAIANVPGARQTFAAFYAHVPVLSGPESQNMIARAYVIGWAIGLQRFYWYAWDEAHYGLADDRGRTDKPATDVYRTTARWLIGSRMLSCERSQAGTWRVHIEPRPNQSTWIVWNDTGDQPFAVPGSWNIRTIVDINDSPKGMSPTIRIGPSPLFLSQ